MFPDLSPLVWCTTLCIWSGICYLFKTIFYALVLWLNWKCRVLLIYLPNIGVSVKSQFVTTFFLSFHCIQRTFLDACLKNGMSSLNTCGGLARDFRSLSQTILMISSWNLVTMPKCIISSKSSTTSSNVQGTPVL